MRIADLNADGKLDIVTTGGGVNVHLGNGDGTFQPFQKFFGGDAPTDVSVGDLNGDGKVDLGVANDVIGMATASVLLGNGDGTFQNPITLKMFGDAPLSAHIADFNGDGVGDLSIGSIYTHSVEIFLSNGMHTVHTDLCGAAHEVGDFNGDGNVDVVHGSFNSRVCVMLGNGDGTLAPYTAHATVGWPAAPVVGDFNRDRKLDIAAADTNGTTMNVLLGNGDGSFRALQEYPTTITGAWLAAGDLNRDRYDDLVMSAYPLPPARKGWPCC